MSAIFLSYAGLDREIATQVARGLQGAGVEVWWDREGIGWGDNWIEKIEKELSRCGGYVILVGPSGVRRWVKFELSLAIKWHIEQELPIFPLLLPGVRPDALPPFLATLQAEPLPDKLSDIDYGKMATRLSHKAPGQPAVSPPTVPGDVCPFPGLEAFGEDNARFFFGRQKETLDAVSSLGLGLDGVYCRWLQVEGTSGVGKSSLVKAGIIPAIMKGWAGSTEAGTWRAWHVVEPMRPGTDPILNLSEALSKSLSREARRLSVVECYSQLSANGNALQLMLRDWVSSKEALVLVIDQLEELFTLISDVNVREHFDDLLAKALSDQDGPLHLVTTIRSDFMMRFNDLPCLQALLQGKASRYFLAPIDERGLKDVVCSPAKVAGLQWSDDQLPHDIVREVRREPAALPLVENLLRLLWLEMQSNASKSLSRQEYNKLGGVGGALAISADRLLDSMGDGRQNALNLLTALVNIGDGQDTPDSRRTVSKAVALQAAGGGTQAEVILNQLSGLRGSDTPGGAPAQPRLVVLSNARRNGVTTDLVELAHETLLRDNYHGKPYWATFRAEIRRQRDKIASRQLVESLAKEWRTKGSPRLFGLATLGQVKAFRRLRGLTDDAGAYVRTSRIAHWAGLMAIILPVVALAGIGMWLWREGVTIQYAGSIALARLHLQQVVEPEMVKISGGTYQAWEFSPSAKSSELAVQTVTIHSFLIGKFEVTFEEYDAYARSAGRQLPPDEKWGRDKHPVINVSWEDAVAYAKWLSLATGKLYRLPTDDEWVFTATSGGKNERWAGTSREEELGDYAWYNENSNGKTHPVGTKKANGLGLYDMTGNVWEWVQNCGGDEDEAKCDKRVVQGGYWGIRPYELGVSRVQTIAGLRENNVGFRLAQDID